MEASATTVNISGPQVPASAEAPKAPNHSHGPNFGRYVAGCGACETKWPDGPPQRKVSHPRAKYGSKVKPESEVTSTTATPVELSTDEMIAKLKAAGIEVNPPSHQNGIPSAIVGTAPATTGLDMDTLMAAMKVLGQELRKPDPEVEAEREAQKVRIKIAKAQERVVIEEKAAKVKALQEACGQLGHKQNQGRSTESAVSGQVHSDNLFHAICLTCGATWTRKPMQHEMSMGVA